MGSSLRGTLRPGRDNWIRQFNEALGTSCNAPDFDIRFIRHLISLLDRRGYGHVAFATLRAAADLADGRADRSEFDALVDLGIDLLAGELADSDAV